MRKPHSLKGDELATRALQQAKRLGAEILVTRYVANVNPSMQEIFLDGDDIVYIARTMVTRVMSVDLHIGSRLPAFCTSMGRVLLAYAERLLQLSAEAASAVHVGVPQGTLRLGALESLAATRLPPILSRSTCAQSTS